MAGSYKAYGASRALKPSLPNYEATVRGMHVSFGPDTALSLSPFLSPLPNTSVYSSRTSELKGSCLPSVARETVAPAREAMAGREPVPVYPEVGEELGLRVLVRSPAPPWVTLSPSCVVRGQVGEQLSCGALGNSSSLSTRCFIYMRWEGLGQNLPGR